MKKGLISLLFCLCVVVFSTQTAEANYVGKIQESRLVISDISMKESPYLNSKEAGVFLKKGELVNAVDIGFGWAYVQTANRGWGYVNRAFLADQTGPSVIRKYTEDVDVQKVILSTALVKEYGITSAKTIGKLQRGDVVKVKQPGYPYPYVWVESSYVSGYVDRKALQPVTSTLKRVSSKSGVSVKPVPNLRPKAVVILPQNAVVQDYGSVGDGWSIVQYGQTVGYVKSNFIGTAKSTKQYAASHIVLRDIMSHSSEIQAIIPRNTEVQVYGTANGWAYVTVGKLKGYVVAKELGTKKQTTADRNVGLDGVMVAHSSIKQSIAYTKQMHDERGRQIQLHFIPVAAKNMGHYMVGLQLVGDSNVYLQKYLDFSGHQFKLLESKENKQLDILNIAIYEPFSTDYRAFTIVSGGLHEFEELNGELQYIGNNQYRETYESYDHPIFIHRIKVYELDMKTLRFLLKTVEKDYYYEDYESSDA